MNSLPFSLLFSDQGGLFNADGTPGSGTPVGDSFDPLGTPQLASPKMPNLLTSEWKDIAGWFGGGNANTTGMSAPVAGAMRTGTSLTNLGLFTSIVGGVGSAVGAYYGAKAQQYQEKSQSSAEAFQSDMASLNASREEMMAETIEESGKNQIANYTMQAGQAKAGAVATMAGRGISLGSGTAADVAASMDIEKSLNVMAINSNTVRQAWAAREQETNDQNQSLIDRTSSVNALRSANSISPVMSGVNTLLGSATKVASQWDYSTWLQKRLAAGLPVPGVETGSN